MLAVSSWEEHQYQYVHFLKGEEWGVWPSGPLRKEEVDYAPSC